METHSLLHDIQHSLEAREIKFEDFQDVLLRLLDYQVIYRRESDIERHYYDRFVEVGDIITDYLSVMGVTVKHHDQGEGKCVIAYPPGADIPGHYTPDERRNEGRLRQSLRREEAGLLLTCRLLFEQKLRDGDVTDSGDVEVPLDMLSNTYHQVTRHNLPEGTVLRQVLTTLRKLRLITYDSLDSEEPWLLIRSLVINFSLDSVTAAIRDTLAETGGGSAAGDSAATTTEGDTNDGKPGDTGGENAENAENAESLFADK